MTSSGRGLCVCFRPLLFTYLIYFNPCVCNCRNDLANIVRRRGHKQIRDLLTSSLYAGIDSLNAGSGLDERPDAANDSEDLLTGQINFFFLTGIFFFCITRDRV